MAKRHGPRPLALHVAHAEWAWRTGAPAKLASFYRGLETYRNHPYHRDHVERTVVWEKGGCRLLDYGPEHGLPLFVVPSLINRGYILDLMPRFSFLDFLGQNGIRPLLLDWGDETARDQRLDLDGLLLDRMKPALEWVHHHVDTKPLALGYCMGGTLATALACLCQSQLAGLALLATPWSFGDIGHDADRRMGPYDAVASQAGFVGSAPVDLLQHAFAQVEPLSVPEKFARFSRMKSASDATTRFVAVEDWLNDGVSLNAEIAAACCLEWYGRNAPANGSWRVDGHPIRPEHLDLPVCLAIPERDRIVPPSSALILADSIPNSVVIRPRAGHVGMIAGENAEASLWKPVSLWLKGIAATQEKSW